MTALIDIDAIRRAYPLPQVAGTLVRLKRSGNELKACCPFHSEKTPSFTVYDGGLKFYCFGCAASGDVLDFIQRLHGVGLREAADILAGGKFPELEAVVPPTAVDIEVDRVDEARAIWRNAQPIDGTLAETYLRSRGIHMPLPDSPRFASLRYGRRGPEHPVLVACIGSADGRFIGIQRTFLQANGLGKAAVSKPKLSLGRVSGGAIRLAPCAASLVVCEGLEDGLTLQQELGKAVWVAAGATMLPSMQFPDIVQSVAIGGDADAAGRRAAWKGAEAFANRGLLASVFFPRSAKDFNAELTGAAA